jgi:hypothetical protein
MKFLLIIGSLGLLLSCSIQTANSATVFIAGYQADASGNQTPGYWQDEVWHPLPAVVNGGNSTAYAIAIDGGNIVVGGNNDAQAGYWFNGNWHPTFSGLSDVNAVFLETGDVYSAGDRYENGISVAGYWKNAEWFPLATPQGIRNSTVTAIQSGYAIGNYNNTDGFWKPGYWRNDLFIELPNYGLNNAANALYKLRFSAMIAGECEVSAGQNRAGYWLDGQWHRIDSGNSFAFGISQNYVVGASDGRACYWTLNGQRTFLSTQSSECTGVAEYGRDLYVTGFIGSQAVVWKNGQAIYLGTGKATAIAIF